VRVGALLPAAVQAAAATHAPETLTLFD